MNPTINGEILHFLQSTGTQFWEHLHELLVFARDNFGHFLWRLLCIFLIFTIARLVLEWVSLLTSRTMKRSRERLEERQSRRVHTLMTLTRSAARYLIYFVALLLALAQFGNGVAQNVVLAVGGIGSIAFGFGAQNLVKDVVTGLFMIFENQFSVGDFIQTEDATGTVEAIAVRVTYLRSIKGDQIIIPNGSIQRVINYTRGSYMAVITVSTAYESDTRQVMQVMKEALTEYGEAHRELLEEMPVIRGIDTFGESTIDISVACRVKPMKQWEVERGMRLAIKEAFDARGIEFPYPRIVTIPRPEENPAPPEVTSSPAGVPENITGWDTPVEDGSDWDIPSEDGSGWDTPVEDADDDGDGDDN